MTDSGSGLVNAVGDIPVAGIPVVAPITIRDEVHTGTELYHMVDRFFGGGLTAGQLHGELQPVCDTGSAGKAQLEHIRHVLNSAASYTGHHVSSELQGVLKDLMEAYQGAASGQMQTQFGKAATMLSTVGPDFSMLARQISSTQDTLDTAWKVVKGYSRLHADESNVLSLNPFGGGDSDDDKAEKAWNQASASLQGIGNQMSNTNSQGPQNISSSPYQPPNDTNPQAIVPDPGSTGPGPGTYAPGPGPGYDPGTYHPGQYHPGQPPHTPGPGGPGPGTSTPGPGYAPGGPGPGYGPGGYGPGGSGPGGYGPGGYGPGGGPGPGGFGGPGPGTGLDTGSELSSAGPGPGYGGPGPGPGPGFGTGGDASGLGAATGPGAASGAGTAGAAGSGGSGGLGAVPMGGRGGAGGGGGGERERSTWLTEDDDVWGDSDAPDGVIS